MIEKTLEQRIYDKHGDTFDTQDIRPFGDRGFAFIFDRDGESYVICTKCLDARPCSFSVEFVHKCEQGK